MYEMYHFKVDKVLFSMPIITVTQELEQPTYIEYVLVYYVNAARLRLHRKLKVYLSDKRNTIHHTPSGEAHRRVLSGDSRR